ncbi:MAG: LexA family transcriptional regulator [Fuerstiella sp.]
MKNEIGGVIRELRHAKGISLRGLAAEVGIHFASLSKIENRKEPVGEPTLRRIAETLDADVDLLLGQAGRKALPYRVLGNIAAGTPIEAAEHIETFDLTEHFDPWEHYLLKVRGDSMILAGINDGDLAVVKHGKQPKNGDVVVAIVDDGEATLKTYTMKDRQVVLSPANRRLKDRTYPAERVEIRGVMVGMIRTSIG